MRTFQHHTVRQIAVFCLNPDKSKLSRVDSSFVGTFHQILYRHHDLEALHRVQMSIEFNIYVNVICVIFFDNNLILYTHNMKYIRLVL